MSLAPAVRRGLVVIPRAHRADVAVGATVAWWATYFTWGSGGQDRHLLSVGLCLLLVASALVRPWQRVPPALCFLLLSIGIGAFTVVAFAPTGWNGASEAASYVYASQLGLLVLAWAQDSVRQMVVLGLVMVASLFEFARGWVQWMAQGSADQVFVGTFYWHNQTGIFLVMGAAVGLPLLAVRASHVRPVAWLCVPLCSAGVIFTTSRGSQMALALGVGLAVLLVLAYQGPRSARLVRMAVALTMAVLLTSVLTGPPFFTERVAATPGAGSRHEALTQNGVNRLEFWTQAVDVFQRWPVTGAGFHSFASASRLVDPHKTLNSAFAHNGFLQLLSDGGLVLAVPVVVVLIVVLVAAVRRLPGSIAKGELAQPVALLGLLLLLLHSGMDFDWSYPALVAAVGLLAPVAAGPPQLPAFTPALVRRSLGLVAVAMLGLSIFAAWDGGILLNVPIVGAA